MDGNPPPVDKNLWAPATEYADYGKYYEINGAPSKDGGNNIGGSLCRADRGHQ